MTQQQRLPEPIDSREICARDPITLALLRLSWWQTVLLAFMIFLSVYLLLGLIVSNGNASKDTLPLTDGRELKFDIFSFGIVVPILWFSCMSEGRATAGLFNGLLRTGVIGRHHKSGLLFSSRFRLDIAAYKSWLLSILIALFAFLAAILWYISTVTDRNNPFLYHYNDFWWSHNRAYSLLYLLQAIINTNIICWIMARRIITTFNLWRILHSYQIIPNTFSDDGCSGFSPVGAYVIRVWWIVIGALLWVMGVTTYPSLYGEKLNLKFDTILYVIFFIVIAPLATFIPALITHSSMTKAKQKALRELADEIRSLRHEINTQYFQSKQKESPITRLLGRKSSHVMRNLDSRIDLQEKETKFASIQRDQATWPFNRSSFIWLALSILLYYLIIPVLIAIGQILIQHKIFPNG